MGSKLFTFPLVLARRSLYLNCSYSSRIHRFSSVVANSLCKPLAIDNELGKCALVPLPTATHVFSRSYAKGKDRKKSDKAKKNVQVNDDLLADVINLESLKVHMQKAIDKLKDEYVKNLSLRSTTGSIETLPITLEGKDYVLQELAQIVRKNPKTVVINMSVFPQAIPIALIALQKSGMNLNPQQDGTTIFIPVPKITKEHRESLSKNAKVLFIKCRDSIKDVQNKYLKSVKSNDKISKDTSHDVQQQIIEIADQYIASADQILSSKQLELSGGN